MASRLLLVSIVLMFVASFVFAKGSAEIGREKADDRAYQHSSPEQDLPALPPLRTHSSPNGAILPGTYTIGPAGTYATLSDAVADLQASGVAGGGTVFFQFNTSMTYSDTGQIIGNYAGQSASNPVVFRPAPGVVATINFTGGSTASNTFGIRLVNAVGVTWDGSNSGSTDRSLTISCDTVPTVGRTAVLIQGGSAFSTLKNLNIAGFRKSTGAASTVVVFDSTGNSLNGVNHDITVMNCHIRRGFNGFFQVGRSAALMDSNITISGNLIGGGATPANLFDNLSRSGINLVQFARNVVIDQNDINGIKTIGAGLLAVEVRGGHQNISITRNKIHNIDIVGGGTAAGVQPLCILVGNIVSNAPGVRTTAYFANNMIYDIHNHSTAGTGTRASRGIAWNPTGGTANSPNGVGSSVVLVNNTFHLDMAAGEYGGAGLIYPIDGNFIGSNNNGFSDSLTMRNNIISGTRGGADQAWAILFIGPTPAGNLNVDADNNLYHVVNQGANGFGAFPSPWPTGATAVIPTLADWQTLSSLDLSSVQGDPMFVSATDAHILTTSLSPADSLGAPWPGVTVDIDGQTRDGSFPDAGADEFAISLPANELGTLSVDTPTPGLAIYRQSTAFVPKATFRNNGSTSHAAADVRFQILDGSLAVVYSNDQQIAIAGFGGTVQASFASVAGGLTAGAYTSRAIARLTGDANSANDTVTASFNVQPVVSSASFPYNENFEDSSPGDAIAGAGWVAVSASGTPNDWVRGTPAKTQLSGAHGGAKAYVTKATGNYSDNQDAYLHAPILDLSSFSGSLAVSFYSNFKTEFQWDGAELQLSTDAGLTWSRVDSTLGTGGNFNTLTSTAWYNADTGFANIAPPYWGGGEGGGVGSAGYTSQSAGWVLSSTTLSGLGGLSDVRFRWRFSADGSVNGEGWAIDDVSIAAASSTVTIGVPVALNWNIVSLPVTSPIPGDSVKQLYTNSVNPYAFAFTGSYQQRFVMINAPGYWIKSSAAYTQDIVGTPLDNLTVPVNNGWNMIGSISTAIDTSAAFVTPSVPGLRGSNYFRYSAGYVVTGTITPGLGFWVKANSAGSFLMHSTGASRPASQGVASGRSIDDLNSITIQDANGGSQTLYFGADSKGEIPVAMFAMPPSPPVGSFDARFASADGGTMVQTHAEEVSEVLDLPITLQSSAYPLTISWNVGDGMYELNDGATSHPMRGEGTVKITNNAIEMITLRVTGGSLPKEFALSQNYPNPFNPTTSVKYALPVDSRVTMEIYNVIGQRVRTLVNDNLEAGYHAAEWNGKNNAGQQLSSGMYFLQLSARGTNGKVFNEVRKLMMLK